MIVLQHEPVVQTILDDWRASLRKDPSSGLCILTEEELRGLVKELVAALDEMVIKSDKSVCDVKEEEVGVHSQ